MDNISKKDLIYFQNEILQDFKNFENKINEKILLINKDLQTHISKSDIKFDSFQEKSLEILINKIENKDSSYLEKFQQNFENSIHSLENQLKLLETDLINLNNKYNSVIKNNLTLQLAQEKLTQLVFF